MLARCWFVPAAQNPSAVQELPQRKQVIGCRWSCERLPASGAVIRSFHMISSSVKKDSARSKKVDRNSKNRQKFWICWDDSVVAAQVRGHYGVFA